MDRVFLKAVAHSFAASYFFKGMRRVTARTGEASIDGRLISSSDSSASPRVAVVSQGCAERYFHPGSAVGHRIRFSSDTPWITIVGVVGDLQVNWFEPVPGPAVYLAYSQAEPRRVTFLVRTEGDPENYRRAVRSAISGLDPLLSSGELSPYSVEVNDSLAPLRVIGNLMLAFGVVALILAAIGVYGLVGHLVAQGTHEFGVRMALGAARNDILRLVLHPRIQRFVAVRHAAGSILASISSITC